LDKLHIYVCDLAHPIQKNGKIQKFQPEGRFQSEAANRFKLMANMDYRRGANRFFAPTIAFDEICGYLTVNNV